MLQKAIRAVYDNDTITVYQAYNAAIAIPAVENQTFVTPFKRSRMTWIKPSFLWMMYRSGWATKENQEHVLAIRIKREGFEWALMNCCLSHFDASVHASYDEWRNTLANAPIRLQWDPEKDIYLNHLSHKSIQIGISGIGVDKYIDEWIVGIEDITAQCHNIYSLLKKGDIAAAEYLLPKENIYTLPEHLRQKVQADN